MDDVRSRVVFTQAGTKMQPCDTRCDSKHDDQASGAGYNTTAIRTPQGPNLQPKTMKQKTQIKTFLKTRIRVLHRREPKHPPNLCVSSPLAASPHGLLRLLDVELGVP